MVLPSPPASTVLARLSELMTTVWQNSHPMCSSLRYLSIKKQSNSNNYNRVARVALRVLFCYHLIWHADIRSWTWRIKSKTSTAILFKETDDDTRYFGCQNYNYIVCENILFNFSCFFENTYGWNTQFLPFLYPNFKYMPCLSNIGDILKKHLGRDWIPLPFRSNSHKSGYYEVYFIMSCWIVLLSDIELFYCQM